MAVILEERLLGTDIQIDATAKRDGVPINLDDIEGFLVYLYYNKSRYLQRYATSATLVAAGWGPIEITNGSAGEFQIKLQSKDTAGGKAGVLFAEYKQEDDIAGWDDTKLHEASDGDEVVRLVESLSKNDKELA